MTRSEAPGRTTWGSGRGPWGAPATRPRSGWRRVPPAILVAAAVAAPLATVAPSAGEGTPARRASVRTAPLAAIAPGSWTGDLGYRKAEIRALSLSPSTGCPLVEVGIGGVRLSLLLDTGTARGFMITDQAPRVPYRAGRRVRELNADGSPRGESRAIRVDSMDVLGARFLAVEGTLTDWRLYSSVPFAGTVGLDFFRDRRLTLDYRTRRVAVSDAPLPDSLDRTRYLVLDLVAPPGGQGHILYVRAVVNGRPALVYLDTGYSASWVDPAFARGQGRGAVRRGVPVVLAGRAFVLDDLREHAIERGPGLDLPVGLVLGSDLLSRFVVTIDLRARKLVLAFAG